MFNFTHDGQDFKVVFAYTHEDTSKDNGVTFADIFFKEIKIPKGLENRHPIFRGEAVCSKEDNFNRIKGRKVALGRALKNMFPEDKRARTSVWDVFKHTCRFIDK